MALVRKAVKSQSGRVRCQNDHSPCLLVLVLLIVALQELDHFLQLLAFSRPCPPLRPPWTG